MKNYFYFFLLIFTISCSNDAVDEQVVQEDILFIEKYLTISEALYKGTATGTSFKIKSALRTFNKDSVKSESTTKAIAILENMSSSNDIEAIRTLFKDLSAIAIEKAGNTGRTFYVENCPMAFNNTGADWLSATEDIHNPYFGPDMPECGSVVRTITMKD